MSAILPLVSVLTPVYNGEDYISECIESVLAQKYTNWEHIIVNNCSTDKTLNIALRYAENDSRIRIVNNSTFVNCEENHNIAFTQIDRGSKYCKVVSADDKIIPECLSEMVGLAEKYPRIGIVGSYQYSNGRIRWKGLPEETEVLSGIEVCRRSLLYRLDVFGNPTSSLYKSDLVRSNTPFLPHNMPHSDTSACFKYLRDYSYGFIHKVCSFERIHNNQESTKVERLGMNYTAKLEIVLEFGPIYLNQYEHSNTIKKVLDNNYRFLGRCLLKMRSKELWDFQVRRSKELGYPIQWHKVLKGAFTEFVEEIKAPNIAVIKFITALRKKHNRQKSF